MLTGALLSANCPKFLPFFEGSLTRKLLTLILSRWTGPIHLKGTAQRDFLPLIFSRMGFLKPVTRYLKAFQIQGNIHDF